MRYFLSKTGILMLLMIVLLSPYNACAENRVYLRVVGDSDAPAAMRTKMQVRDALLSACPENPYLLPAALPYLSDIANQTAACAVSLRCWAPVKNGPALMTLYVQIGHGRGKNWFGLLYENAPRMFAQGENTDHWIFDWPFLCWLFGKPVTK